MNDTRCSFCTLNLDEVSCLVRAGHGVMICLGCARRCVEICEAENAPVVSRFPRPELDMAAPRPAPDTRYLDAFMYHAQMWTRGHVPPEVAPWVCQFCEAYEGKVLDTVKAAEGWPTGSLRSERVARDFNDMMEAYRGDRRRPYLGALFSDVLGRSIREGFSYHVDMTVLAPAVRPRPRARAHSLREMEAGQCRA